MRVFIFDRLRLPFHHLAQHKHLYLNHFDLLALSGVEDSFLTFISSYVILVKRERPILNLNFLSKVSSQISRMVPDFVFGFIPNLYRKLLHTPWLHIIFIVVSVVPPLEVVLALQVFIPFVTPI